MKHLALTMVLTLVAATLPHDTIVDETFAALVAHLCGTDHPPSHPLDQRLS